MKRIRFLYENYSEGRYDVCMKIIDNLENNEFSSTDNAIWNSIHQSNKALCSIFMKLHSFEEAECEDILKLLKQRYEFHRDMPRFHKQLKLNFAFNYLYWYWFKLSSLPSFYVWNIVTRVRKLLATVLRWYENSYIETESGDWNDSEQVGYLLNRVANQTVKVSPMESLQLVDIIHVCLLLLYSCSSHMGRNELFHYKTFSERFVLSIDSLRLHLKPPAEDQLPISSKCGYFKFGFKHINNQLDLRYYKTSLISFLFTLSLFYLKDQMYGEATVILEKAGQYDTKKQFESTSYYLKAYACYHLNRLQECRYLLVNAYSTVMSDFQKSRVVILDGLVESRSGNHKQAMLEFNKVIDELTCCKNTALYYKACENKLQNLFTSHLVCLREMIENIKSKPSESDIFKFEELYCRNYENKILHILHPEPEITICDALYVEANTSLRYNYYKTAASLYNELLEKVKSKSTLRISGSLKILPETGILHHETILANFKAGYYTQAEELANNFVDYYVRYGTAEVTIGSYDTLFEQIRTVVTTSTSDWYSCLYHFENDVITLLLLSDIYQQMENLQLQMVVLNKCYNILYTYMDARFSPMLMKTQKLDNTAECFSRDKSSLPNKLMCKILLRKANLLFKLNDKNEAENCFKKALSFNPDDKDLLYFYRQFLICENREDEAKNLKTKAEENDIPETCADYAILYLLHSTVKPEDLDEIVLRDDDTFQEEDDDDLLTNLYED